MKVLGLLVLLVAAISAFVVVDPEIDIAFKKAQSVDVLVHLPQYQRPEKRTQTTETRAEGRARVYKERTTHNAKYQPKFLSLLSSSFENLEVKPFWIINSVLIKNVNPEIIQKILTLPDVVEIEMDKVFASVMDPIVHEVNTTAKQPNLEWNIDLIGAPRAWEIAKGEGVVVANIDTGVRYTHESLVANYRGNIGGGSFDHDYNWYDPWGKRVPFDNDGHGTHTMGILVGSKETGIGVAPGAKWIAAKGCITNNSCSVGDIAFSAEFVLCPTKQGGSSPDCSKGADIVSFSWAIGRGADILIIYIQAWVDAGLIPVFAQGNFGPSCFTANSPGDLGIVIGVGSTNRNDALSSFSSRGPGVVLPTHPPQKPDISAPGEMIRSAYASDDSHYGVFSGTGFACPTVAGVIALMLSANPSLNYDQIYEIITKTAKTSLPAPNGGDRTCAGVSYTQTPNYHYGYGRIDAYRAVVASLNF